eukprot:scaffold33992_cov59-Phaeocystis_antarctica.AAC.6
MQNEVLSQKVLKPYFTLTLPRGCLLRSKADPNSSSNSSSAAKPSSTSVNTACLPIPLADGINKLAAGAAGAEGATCAGGAKGQQALPLRAAGTAAVPGASPVALASLAFQWLAQRSSNAAAAVASRAPEEITPTALSTPALPTAAAAKGVGAMGAIALCLIPALSGRCCPPLVSSEKRGTTGSHLEHQLLVSRGPAPPCDDGEVARDLMRSRRHWPCLFWH